MLLGEAKEGLVWAVLVLNRREDDKDERSFWWRLKGHVELASYDGSSARVLQHQHAIRRRCKNPGGADGYLQHAIRKYLTRSPGGWGCRASAGPKLCGNMTATTRALADRGVWRQRGSH